MTVSGRHAALLGSAGRRVTPPVPAFLWNPTGAGNSGSTLPAPTVGGGAWNYTGSWQTVGGEGGANFGSNVDNIALNDCGRSDGVFIFRCRMSPSTGVGKRCNMGIWVRCSDPNNGVLISFGYDGGGGDPWFTAYKKITTTYTALPGMSDTLIKDMRWEGDGTATTGGVSLEVRVELAGTSMKVYRGDRLALNYTFSGAEQTALGSNTKIGFRVFTGASNDDGGSRFTYARAAA